MKRYQNELDIIYRKYYKDVLYFARSLAGNIDVAEEITQNTFCKAIQSAHTFRGECDIRVWLCKIAKNDYLNYLRKEKRLISDDHVEDMLLNIPDNAEPVIHRIEDAEAAAEIRRILEEMEEPYREACKYRTIPVEWTESMMESMQVVETDSGLYLKRDGDNSWGEMRREDCSDGVYKFYLGESFVERYSLVKAWYAHTTYTQLTESEQVSGENKITKVAYCDKDGNILYVLWEK